MIFNELFNKLNDCKPNYAKSLILPNFDDNTNILLYYLKILIFAIIQPFYVLYSLTQGIKKIADELRNFFAGLINLIVIPTYLIIVGIYPIFQEAKHDGLNRTFHYIPYFIEKNDSDKSNFIAYHKVRITNEFKFLISRVFYKPLVTLVTLPINFIKLLCFPFQTDKKVVLKTQSKNIIFGLINLISYSIAIPFNIIYFILELFNANDNRFKYEEDPGVPVGAGGNDSFANDNRFKYQKPANKTLKIKNNDSVFTRLYKAIVNFLCFLISLILQPFYILYSIFDGTGDPRNGTGYSKKLRLESELKNLLFILKKLIIWALLLILELILATAHCLESIIMAYNTISNKTYDAITEKTSMKYLCFALTAICGIILALRYSVTTSINAHAAIIALGAFAILATISLFSKKSNWFRGTSEYYNISPGQKFAFTLLSAASAITAFGLESSHIYFFNNFYTLTAAIVLPSIITMLYCMTARSFGVYVVRYTDPYLFGEKIRKARLPELIESSFGLENTPKKNNKKHFEH